MTVAELFGLIGFKLDKASTERANKAIEGVQKKLDGIFQDKNGRWRTANGRFLTMAEKAELGLGRAGSAAKGAEGKLDGVAAAARRVGLAIAAYFGVRAAGAALISFNADVQDTKTQIAGMLALTKKTDLADQIGTADQLFANLQRRAASLPGTTAEYAQMAGAITQPIIDAGLALQDLEDITVNAVVGAKAFGIAWDVAARDIDQALRGQFKSVDAFSGKILGSMGFKGEAGRERFNALSAKQRGETLKQALTQKQLTQLADAQGQSFRGMLAQLQDAAQQFFGRIGAPLFRAITAELKNWSKWLDENRERVSAFADTMAGALAAAFEGVKLAVAGVVEVIGFFIEHAELGESVLIALGVVLAAFAVKAAAAWLIAFAPLILLVAKIALLVFAVRKMIDIFKHGSTAMKIAIAAVAFALGLLLGPIYPIAAAVAAIVAYWDDVKQAVLDAKDAVADFLDEYNPFKSISFDDVRNQLIANRQAGSASVVPAHAAAGASSSTTNNVNATFNVTGSNPEEIATVVDKRIKQTFSDAYDTRRGGRR